MAEQLDIFINNVFVSPYATKKVVISHKSISKCLMALFTLVQSTDTFTWEQVEKIHIEETEYGYDAIVTYTI